MRILFLLCFVGVALSTFIQRHHSVVNETQANITTSKNIPTFCHFLNLPNYTHFITTRLPFAELVISACDEDLKWINMVSFFFQRITIYDKCGSLNRTHYNSLRVVRVVRMANVGSADGAYLRHITTHYDVLAPYIVFTKGKSKFSPVISLKTIQTKQPQYVHYFCPYNHSVPPKYQFHEKFQMKEYAFFRNNAQRTEGLTHTYKGPYGTLGDWLREMFGEKIRSQLLQIAADRHGSFCQQGYFALTRATIHKHPHYVYATLHHQQRYTSEEIDHYMERLWEALFLMPVSIRCL
jgi:hypothetical protein